MPLKFTLIGLSWLVFGFTSSLYGQTKFTFKHFFPEDGLSQSTVSAIAQDYQGFMWFGTFKGLNRFDGYAFQIYNHDIGDSTSLISNHIESILEDSKQNLWLGTAEGIDRYNRRTNTFEHFAYSTQGVTTNKTAVALVETPDGRVWVGGWQGLSYIDTETKQVIPFYPGFSSTENQKPVTALAVDALGNLWVGTDEGLQYYDLKQKRVIEYVHQPNIDGSLPSNKIASIMVDKQGTLWIGANEGIARLQKGSDNFERMFTDKRTEIVHDILAYESHSILFATEQGLFAYYLPTKALTIYTRTTKQNLTDQLVKCMFQDQDHNLWFGTFNGLNFTGSTPKLNGLGKETIDQPGLKNPYVLSVMEDKDDYLWIGTGIGLEVLDASTETIAIITTKYPELDRAIDRPILSMATNGINTFITAWIGEIYAFNSNTQKIIKLANPDFEFCGGPLILYQNDNFWLACSNSLYRFNKNTAAFELHKTFEGANINFFYADSQGDFWLSTQPGLLRYNPTTKKLVNFKEDKNNPQSLNAKTVNCLYEDGNGVFWIGTDQGLYQLENGKFKRMREELGSLLLDIKSIQEDNNNFLWIATNQGIYRMEKESFTVRRFDLSDGLQGKEFFKNAGLKTRSGKLVFGATKGVTIFHPDSVSDDLNPPKVVITDFRILNRPVPIGSSKLSSHISVASNVVLDYTDSEFSFEFVALNYTSSQKNQYAYKLEGFDKDWNYVGTRRFASYTNLPTGKDYVFRVKAANGNNVWNEQGTSIKLYIHPAFWETWWFKFFIYVTSAAIVLLAFRIRSTVLRKQKIQLQKEVNQRTAELKLANVHLRVQAKKIEELNEALKKDNVKLEHDVKDLAQARILQQWVSFEEFKSIYATPESCYQFIEELKWGKGFQCKKCGNAKSTPTQSEYARKCSKCNYIETITAGTVFEGVKFPITKAFYLLFLINEEEDYTLKELAALVDLNPKTCWSFKKRVEERTKRKGHRRHKDGLAQLITLT